MKSKKKPKSGRKAHWFSSDRPIESARADVLGRSAFALRLAESIGAWDGRDSLVIALHGGWGTGKTSVKNMVLEKLRANPARCPQIVEFSPWQVSGTGTLVGTFFNELAVALGVGQKRKTGLLVKLSAYAKPLIFFGHAAKPIGAATALVEPIAGSLIAAGGIAAEQSAQVIQTGVEASRATQDAKAKSLADLKRDLGTGLASLPRPFLVVIDDIDRLTTEEILQVFQLVKVNADFPNLVYLLLFERSIIEKALDRISGDRGHEFLQKIVQVEFHVPHAHRKAIEKVLFAGLDKFIGEEAIKPLFDKHRWRDLYGEGIAQYFQNLRHVYRFLGSFQFHVAQFKCGGSFEVNPVDLIGLEALRVFEPGFYEQLPSAKRILTRDEGRGLFGRIRQVEIDACIGQLMTRVPSERQAQVKSILGVVFPSISNSFDSEGGVSATKHQWLREHRVCHADLFDKFFTLVVEEGDLSQAELDGLLSLTSNRKAFVAECRALMSRGLLELAFERLDAYHEHIPLESMQSLIEALCDLSDGFPEEKESMFDRNLNVYAWRFVFFGLKREPDAQKRLHILRRAISDSNGLALPVEIVSLEERVGDREARGHEFLIEEADLLELKLICAQKLRTASQQVDFTNNPRLKSYLWRWSDWASQAEVRSWVRDHTQNPEGVAWFLSVLLGVIHSWGAQHRVRYHIDLSTIEHFSDVEEISRQIDQVQPAQLSKKEAVAVREFRKALQRRAEGKPDDAWKHCRDAEFDDIIE